MTEEAYERWVSIAPEVFEEFVPFDEPENLEGVDEEGGAQLVGTSRIKLQLLPGRVGEMEVSVLRNGTTGSADILIGNRVQRAERWHGSTDIGRDIIKLRRPPDGLGRVKIPIQWKLWDKTEKEHARTMLMDKQHMLIHKMEPQLHSHLLLVSVMLKLLKFGTMVLQLMLTHSN